MLTLRYNSIDVQYMKYRHFPPNCLNSWKKTEENTRFSYFIIYLIALLCKLHFLTGAIKKKMT